MSKDINAVSITGNLTRDAELRSLPSGTPVLNFGVAVNDSRKNQQTGEWEDYPNFVDCTIFGNYATALAQHLTKGLRVAVLGRLRFESWEQDGQRRSRLSVVADTVKTMGQRQETAEGRAQRATQAAAAYAGQQKPPSRDAYDEDIPF